MSSNNYSKYSNRDGSNEKESRKDHDDRYSKDRRSPKRDWKRRSRSPSYDSYKPKRSSDYDKEKSRDYARDYKDFGDSRSKFKSDGFAGSTLLPVDWSKYQLTPFKKNFYVEHDNVKDRSEKEIEQFRTENRITIRSSWAPTPIFTFEEASLPKPITDSIQRCGYLKPTPIQCQGWPAALSGHDVIGIAQTGSGKTASFLIPGIVHINAQSPLLQNDGPVALVLAPTRELTMQIALECEKFTKNSNIRSVCVYGGADKYPQQRELQRGAHIIIACPGRLLDFLEMKVVNLRRVTYLVLDEADRMLDMGFEPQIRKILSQIRPDRQTLMWSATWPKEVQKMALDFCREKPIHIVIGDSDLAVNSCIKQNVEVLDESMKESRIIKLLENITDGSKILIFCQTKRGCDKLADALKREKYHAISIHGDKSQNQRDYIMRNFKTGRSSILVATDLAARGLDVSDIFYVINYDFPMLLEDYIHRVGRTGRAGRKGISFTFFTRGNFKHASGLIDILEEASQKVPTELYKMARRPIPIGNHQSGSKDDDKPKYSSNSYQSYSSNTRQSYGGSSWNSDHNRQSYSGSKSKFEFTSGPSSNQSSMPSYSQKPYNSVPHQVPQYQYSSYQAVGPNMNQQSQGSYSEKPSAQQTNGGSTNSGSEHQNGMTNGSIPKPPTTNAFQKDEMLRNFFNYSFMLPPPIIPTIPTTTQTGHSQQQMYPNNNMNWFYLNQLQNNTSQTQQNGVQSQSTQNKPVEKVDAQAEVKQ